MTLAELSKDIDFDAKLVRDDFLTSNGHNGKLDLSGQSHWLITLVCNGCSFCTEYSQGAAYREGRKGRKVSFNYSGRYSVSDIAALRDTMPTVPVLLDVLHCLVSDAQCVEYNTFEDFCGDMGYDTDSKSAEKTYNECCNTRAALNGMFDLEELYRLFEDY